MIAIGGRARARHAAEEGLVVLGGPCSRGVRAISRLRSCRRRWSSPGCRARCRSRSGPSRTARCPPRTRASGRGRRCSGRGCSGGGSSAPGPLAGARGRAASAFGSPDGGTNVIVRSQLPRPLPSLTVPAALLEQDRRVVADGLRRGDEAQRRVEDPVGVDQQVEPVEDVRVLLEVEQRLGGRRQLGVERPASARSAGMPA